MLSYECVCNENYFGNGFKCSGWNIQNELLTDRYGDEGWGHWQNVALCPNETYADAFALKVNASWKFSRLHSFVVVSFVSFISYFYFFIYYGNRSILRTETAGGKTIQH